MTASAAMPSARKGLVVAIDGPSGAGKSTVGRALAEALGYTYLDTGAMYRAMALRALEENIPLDDEDALARAATASVITFDATGSRVMLNGKDVSDAVRTRGVTQAASAVARIGAVRRELVRQQQQIGQAGGVVLDGRDIGTVVFPHADVKFYLDAAAENRAQRRFDELKARGEEASYDTILDEIRARDHQDMTRLDSPLTRSFDAILIDSTDLSREDVIAKLLAFVKDRAESR